MNAWSHLPNAAHIDRVIASANAHPELWNQAWRQAWEQVWDQALAQALAQAWDQARDQAWEQVWDQALAQAWDQARDQALAQARDQVWDQARSVLLALIAYDDSAKYLNLPIDQLEMLYHLTEHPVCLLLQPAVIVFAKEKELAQG